MTSRTTATEHVSPTMAVRPAAPRVFSGPFAEVGAEAAACNEPLFMPATVFADDRGWSLMNLLHGAMSSSGQINVSVQFPGVIKAWHRHDLQTDYWVCISGQLKAGVYREDDGARWVQVFGERRPGVLVIPPPLWHGAATVGPDSATLLYYVTHGYNPHQPDEHRRAWDSVDGFPWMVQHG